MLFKDYLKSNRCYKTSVCIEVIGDNLFERLGYYNTLDPDLKTIIDDSEIVDIVVEEDIVFVSVKLEGVVEIDHQSVCVTVLKYSDGKVSRFTEK